MRGASAAKGLKYPKPETRATTKAKRDRAEAAHIAEIRRQVFERDESCRICGSRMYGEMHEVAPRSKTRGMPLDQRFCLENCVRLCSTCHREVTEHLLSCAIVSLAANGIWHFVWWHTGSDTLQSIQPLEMRDQWRAW